MRRYEKPIVNINEELAEGVYANSGQECYTVSTLITQVPELGRDTCVVQVNSTHMATDNHHGSAQVLTITFNQVVDYVSSNGTLISGSGTNTLMIQYNYHANPTYDNIGLGDLSVVAYADLAVTSATLSCNYFCDQH